MTITRLFFTGYESGQAEYEFTGYDSVPSMNTQYAKTGWYSSAHTSIYAYKEISTPIAQCRLGFHLMQSASSSNNHDVIAFASGDTPVVRLKWQGSTKTWQVLCGATSVATGVDADALNQLVWYHIGIDVKIDATAGWVYVYRDGIPVITYTGKTNHGGDTINRYYEGMTAFDSITGPSASYYDNMYWDDTTGEAAPAPCPDLQFVYLRAAGNGAVSQWMGSDGNKTSNYALVDEHPPNEASDYLYSSTVGEQDLWDLTSFTLPEGRIVHAVCPTVVAMRADALGTTQLKLLARSGGSNVASDPITVPTDWTILKGRLTEKPGGGAWDAAALATLEGGIEVA